MSCTATRRTRVLRFTDDVTLPGQAWLAFLRALERRLLEAAAGDVEYRCVYLHNANGVDTMTAAVVFVSANTPLAGTTLDIGVGTSAVNGTEQTIANETTAPTSVTFSAPSTAGTGLALGDIPPGQHRAIWLRRTVTAGSGSSANDTWTLGYQCETV